ncbi:alcohol dehydrogenase catalytic domain-containing protein [Streptomyces sp. PRKS01-29]|nr:alcohol dehydrogenase catalytic domain-containing protein [Streptomyces sabulosicollis]MBI0293152.1 alcohol dehydrogenase catalytic domain-containing protein [Streptomyces sabulosicollis]
MSATVHTAIVWEGPRRARAEERKAPGALGPGEVRVRVTSVGVCGTDLTVWSGQAARGRPGTVLGHEFGGRVIARADDVGSVEIHDLVAVDPNVSCGTCAHCGRGRRARCADRRLMGVDLDGGFQRTVDVAVEQLVPAPGADPRALGLVEPVAVGVHAVARAGIADGDRLGVIGGGPIGMASVVEARRRGAGCTVLESDETRRTAIARTGAAAVAADRWPDRGLDAVIDTVGRAATVQAALDAVRDGGRVCIVGLSHDDHLPPPDQVVRREATLIGSFCYSTADLRTAAEIVVGQGLNTVPVDLTAGFERVPDLLDRVGGGLMGRGKALVVVRDEGPIA